MPFRGGAAAGPDAELNLGQLVALLDHLPAMVAYWDRDLRNVVANSAYIEWFGRTPEEMRGMHIREVLGEAVYAKNLPFITGALRGEEQLFERTLVDTAGRVRHTQASYVPDVDDGETRGFFVLVTDVTPRVEAQRSMDEAQRLARLGSWSLDVATGTITWSEELYRIFGVDPEVFVPEVEELLERLDPRDAPAARRQLDEAMESGREYDLTYRIRRADGQLREVHSRGRPVADSSGTVVRIAGTLQDVTEANLAARELSRVNGELRQVNQLNADVLAMLGHDVRAPIAVVLGYLEELVEMWDQTSESDRREHLSRALVAARRVRALVDNILAMARVDSGQIVAHPLDLDAVGLLREAVEAVGGGAVVKVTASGDPRVHADPFHLRQTISNLVANALRHGAPPYRVHVEDAPGDTVAIVVSDHGLGIPPDQVGSLFERFVGVDRTGIPAGAASTGFGLYIAAGLMAANQGTIEYVGSADGASFRVTVPSAAT